MAKKIPTGVKVISVIYYIAAVLTLIAGIAMIAGGGLFASLMPPIIAGMAVIVGVILIAIAVLGYFVGRGLWKAQNWARIIAVICAVIGVILALMNIFVGNMQSIVGLIIHGIIGYYLYFNKEVKKAFK